MKPVAPTGITSRKGRKTKFLEAHTLNVLAQKIYMFMLSHGKKHRSWGNTYVPGMPLLGLGMKQFLARMEQANLILAFAQKIPFSRLASACYKECNNNTYQHSGLVNFEAGDTPPCQQDLPNGRRAMPTIFTFPFRLRIIASYTFLRINSTLTVRQAVVLCSSQSTSPAGLQSIGE